MAKKAAHPVSEMRGQPMGYLHSGKHNPNPGLLGLFPVGHAPGSNIPLLRFGLGNLPIRAGNDCAGRSISDLLKMIGERFYVIDI